jgi:hypothetical protein
MKCVLITVTLLFSVVACDKSSDFLHTIDPPPPVEKAKTVSTSYTLQQISKSSASQEVDILWVIDNSGSMGSYQNQVIFNADVFIKKFTAGSNLEWKMGLISTAYQEDPYIGFVDVLDWKTPDPVTLFTDAVRRLGTSGDSSETSFNNILKVLKNYPTFLRPNAYLAVIYVSDEEEQSVEGISCGFADQWSCYNNSTTFMEKLITLKGGNGGKILQYGIFLPNSFGYQDSYYNHFATYAAGNIYSLQADFGTTLANIGQDLVSKTVELSPTILLNERPPDERDIRVYHAGKELKYGFPSDGGTWVYEPLYNRIRITNLGVINASKPQITVNWVLQPK